MPRHLPLYKAIALILSLSLVSGCWDAREIEERTAAVAVALDKVGDQVEVTVEIPDPLKISGGGGEGSGEGGEEAVQLLSGKGDTVTDALDEIQFKSNQDLFLGNSQLLLIGEELARAGIRDVLDSFRRNPEIRRRQWPVVVKGRAKEALKITPKLEQVPMDYLLNMLETGVRSGLFLREGLNDLYVDLSSPGKEPVLNLIEAESEKAKWVGGAVFHRDRLVGFLDQNETGALVRIRQQFTGETLNAPCGSQSGWVVFRPKELNRKVKIQEVKGRPKIHTTLDITGDLVEKNCNMDLSQEEAVKKIKSSVKKRLEKRAQALVQKAQQDLKTDIFNYGNRIRALHPDMWERMDWDQVFPQADIQISYKVEIRRIGLQAR